MLEKLPITAQIKVIKNLNYTDLKSARLTCSTWLAIINQVQKPTFTISDFGRHPSIIERYQANPLKLLKDSFYGVIGTLEVERLDYKPIPIYSSTRMLIPTANKLVLKKGNSEENVVKLLRYYLQSCQSLFFDGFCFKDVTPHRLKNDYRFLSVREFGMKLKMDWGPYWDEHDRPHCKALFEFLKTAKFPNLKTFHFDVDVRDDKDPQPKMVGGMEHFLKNNGSSIQNLIIQLKNYNFHQLFQYFQHLTSLESFKLGFGYFYLNPFSDLFVTSMTQGIGQLRGLKTFSFDMPFDYSTQRENPLTAELSLMALENNKETLESVHLQFVQGAIEMAHRICPNLKYLEVWTFYDENTLAYEVKPQYNLSGVQELFILFPWHETDWRGELTTWILKYTPRLKTLQICYEHLEFIPSLPDIRPLIIGLKYLSCLKLQKSGGYGRSGLKVEPQLMNWFESMMCIKATRQPPYGRQVRVYIARPFKEITE